MDVNVLVIAANPFSDVNNNGKTLKSIFSAFSKDNLFELYFRPQDNPIGDGDYAKSYYAVSELDIIRSLLHFSRKCGGTQHFDRSCPSETTDGKTYQRLFHSKLKNIKWLRSLLWKSRKWDTDEYRNWYVQCQPDIVFALLGAPSPGASYKMATEISESLHIPLAVYFTDDYLIHPLRKSIFDKLQFKKDLKEYKKIVEKSSLLFTIGEQMSQEYTEFFGKSFTPIMNSVTVYPFEPKTTNDDITISYFGGLNLNRWKMVSKVASIVGQKAKVIVYTGQEISSDIYESFIRAGVILGGFLQGDKVREKMMESDILLHIESDDEDYRALTSLSISTKIPEYMMSSRPIIAFGPQEIASMRLVADNNLGVAVSSEDSLNNQKEKIFQLIDNPHLRNELARKAHDYASTTFNREIIATELKNKLSNVACGIH